MSNHDVNEDLLNQVVDIVERAGSEVLEIYKSGEVEIDRKQNEDPITSADRASNKVILHELGEISNYPVVSEENEQREARSTFWLVDPIDGTKDFIRRTDEFTVNIALIREGEPVLGVVGAPALGTIYAGAKEVGAFKIKDGKKTALTAEYDGTIPKIIMSNAHKGEKMDNLLAPIGTYEATGIGSSLKYCMLAEGNAFMFPRLGPQYGWDTAAGDAVLRAAGGFVVDVDGQPLSYVPRARLNPDKILAGTKNAAIKQPEILERMKNITVSKSD